MVTGHHNPTQTLPPKFGGSNLTTTKKETNMFDVKYPRLGTLGLTILLVTGCDGTLPLPARPSVGFDGDFGAITKETELNYVDYFGEVPGADEAITLRLSEKLSFEETPFERTEDQPIDANGRYGGRIVLDQLCGFDIGDEYCTACDASTLLKLSSRDPVTAQSAWAVTVLRAEEGCSWMVREIAPYEPG